MSRVDTDPCEICRKEHTETLPANSDGIHMRCPRCGEYQLSGTASVLMRQPLGEVKRALISGWVS